MGAMTSKSAEGTSLERSAIWHRSGGERVWPAVEPDERTVLPGWLRFNRQNVEIKCDGLTHKQLVERPLPPSSLSMLGIVRHLDNMEVTRLLWFAGDPVQMPTGDRDFDDAASADVDEAFDTWRQHCQRGDDIIAAASSLDDSGAPLPEIVDGLVDWDVVHTGARLSLRNVITNLNYEYARHTGHLDLIREQIDGQVGY